MTDVIAHPGAVPGSEDLPLVTAVMIFLNGEKYIAEAIDSILAQTYPNWELVLVDDGSTDGATAIARDYAARHPDRIRYIDHPGHENRGMSASRNSGVAEGRGVYVSFLDADDIWLPERLEHFVEVAGDYPEAGMVYGPTLYWFSWAEARGEKPPVEGQDDFLGHLDLPTDELIEAPAALRRFIVTEGACLPGICSLLVRRDAYLRIGGFEPSFRGLYEDQVFLSKMTATHPVVVIEEVLDYYRQHSESCCYRSLARGEYDLEGLHPARGRYLKWLRDYLKTIGVADPVLSRALRRQLRLHEIPGLAVGVKVWRQTRRWVRRTLRKYTPRFLKVLRYRLYLKYDSWRYPPPPGQA
ncbi:glycosyltransferase family A protein [Novosphingobium sp. MD-1]|uniref:glycosyltransferase family 2 protein n=1 Tax=Novosphingobium sp. MD-1 TaxID=1630648 RepID=UPI000F7DF6C2|nr:glycosyltransferase family A protein [Novosphingobium sp. MD-1]